METIKANTRKGQAYKQAHENATAVCLSDVYGTYSCYKVRAYNTCIGKCQEEKGTAFRIISHSLAYFTVAWLRPDGNLRVETAYSSYLIA